MKPNRYITLCGIGPGSKSYILPIVFEKVKDADLLIGGRRHLEIFASYTQADQWVITAQLDKILSKIEECTGNVVVVVSGDTGFYSLRSYLSKKLLNVSIDVIPGISSFQYFYARLGKGYEKAYISSMHGKSVDFISLLPQYESIFLLTDAKTNGQYIAQILCEEGLKNIHMHVGNRLSYPDETIVSGKAEDIVKLDMELDLCSVIIENGSYERF